LPFEEIAMPVNRAAHLEYELRINRVMDFIHAHIDQPLPLETLAREACFSPFHFHRIFHALTGETLNDFIWRIRLEKAANMLINRPHLNIFDIALQCGFSSASNFAKALKKRYGVSATHIRKKSKLGAANRNAGKASRLQKVYTQARSKAAKIRKFKAQVRLETFPARPVAYRRSLGGYKAAALHSLWEKVCRWAVARGLYRLGALNIGIGHDNPSLTPSDKCRYDAAVTLPDNFQVTGAMNTTVIPAGIYAVFRFKGRGEDLESAYHYFYFEWLPNSGLVPGGFPPLEICLKNPGDKPKGVFVADICILVEPFP
jgi:AraC family transcriptional regulator